MLNRLVEDSHALGRVAREALKLMHFEKVDDAITAGDARLLSDHEDEACVRGCYRCLLSYFNQPDHELIDRKSDEAKQLLIDLARGEVVLAVSASVADPADGWRAAFKDAGIPDPDATPVKFGEQQVDYSWRSHFVVACIQPLSHAAREVADAKGWTVFELPENPSASLPDDMISTLRV